jgi:hypothetical protein
MERTLKELTCDRCGLQETKELAFERKDCKIQRLSIEGLKSSYFDGDYCHQCIQTILEEIRPIVKKKEKPGVPER